MRKMTKIVKIRKKEQNKVFQVIHTRSAKKGGKTLGF